MPPSLTSDSCWPGRTATPPRHRGITMFIVPMDRPGIDVRPLRQMDEESKFSEVHLTDVELTAEDVLGSPNEGWAIAGDVLGRERSGIGAHAVTLAAGARGPARRGSVPRSAGQPGLPPAVGGGVVPGPAAANLVAARADRDKPVPTTRSARC